MHVYLAPFTGSGKADDEFQLVGMKDLPGSTLCGDLRPDETSVTGYGFLFTPTRNDLAVVGGVYLGEESDWDTVSLTAKSALALKLGVTLTSTTPRTLMQEIMVTKSPRPTTKMVVNGATVFSQVVIAGGSTQQDSFDRADNNALGTASDSSFTWIELDNFFSISSNKGRGTGEATGSNFDIAHTDTDLASDAHSVQAVLRFVTSSAAFRCGLIWRKHATSSTRTYYGFRLRFDTADWQVLKLVTGSATNISTGAFSQSTGVDYTLYGESDASNNLTAKIDGTTKYGPTTQSDITGNMRTGLLLTSNIGSNDAVWNDFIAQDLAGLTAAQELPAFDQLMGSIALGARYV